MGCGGVGWRKLFFHSLTLPEMRLFSGLYLRLLCGLTSWSWQPCSELSLTAGMWTYHRSRSLTWDRRSNHGLWISPSRSSQSRAETDVRKIQSQKVRPALTLGKSPGKGQLTSSQSPELDHTDRWLQEPRSSRQLIKTKIVQLLQIRYGREGYWCHLANSVNPLISVFFHPQ